MKRHVPVIAIAIAIVTMACGHKDKPNAGSGSSAIPVGHPILVDAPPPPVVDWTACNTALRKAATEPLDVRPQLVIDGCVVCGDWAPILRWNHPQTEKGPTRAEIAAAMEVCGFCNSNAKQRFLGTLDNARGTSARTPWRYLGEQCKGEVSALPDNRFTTAPYYALDRIARAATAHGGESANLMAAIELPLPAVSVTGTGMTLPDVDASEPPGEQVPSGRGAISPTAGPLAITMMGDGLHVAKLPRARLGPNGLAVDLGNYPGDVVKAADLAATLKKLAAGDATATIAILAPVATPAEDIAKVAATASTVAATYLAVNAHGSPEGWDLPATIPVALVATGGDSLKLSGEMTAQLLASELAKRAKAGQKKIVLH